MSQEPEPTPEQVEVINGHLDALLGMDVRKPGTAATLPAVIRIIETLEPAGGKEFPVFPPSYAGEGKKPPPMYDLNGIEWGEVLREKSAKDGTKHITRYIKRARHCTMDSPQSHANRTEVAFRDDPDLCGLVPQAEAKIPRKREFTDQSNTNLLALPHRVADFRVRASDQKDAAAKAIKALARGDALPLLQFMPTSIIFGFWDSRAKGYQHKHARILLTRIDAFDVVPCERRSLYTGPYSKDECASVVLGDEILAQEFSEHDDKTADEAERSKKGEKAKEWEDKMAKRGFSNALGSGLGGVFAGRIERLALISLTDIASIFCLTSQEGSDTVNSDRGAQPLLASSKSAAQGQRTENAEPGRPSEPDKDLTNAARRYLLALALLAESHPRSTGSYRLRSGCELLPLEKTIELLGAGSKSTEAAAVKALCGNRPLLIKVAKAAHAVLQIPATPGAEIFKSTAASLRDDLEQGGKGKKGKTSGGKPTKRARGPAAVEGSTDIEEPKTENQSD